METLKMPKPGEGETIHRETVKTNEFVEADVMLYHAGQLAKTYAAKQLASKAHAKARAMFKNTGVGLRQFDLVNDLASQDDPADALDKFLREVVHMAQVFIGVPPGTQIDLFAGPKSATAEMDKAFITGRNRGLMGLFADDQAYQANTPLGQEHLRGWNDGQAKLQEQFVAYNEAAAKEEAAKKAKGESKKAKSTPKNDDGETVQ